MAPKRRALILYATMTSNTEKIANAFKETFEHYLWEVNMVKLRFPVSKMMELQDQLYFDDYDMILLGSPIVGGNPLNIVTKLLSLGGGVGGLDRSDRPADEKAAPPPNTAGAPEMVLWRRRAIPYMGGPSIYNEQKLGLVFTTYGGGFFGSREANATLAMLRQYLELNDVDVIGTFACCGRETGPAGLADGVIPTCMDPEMTEEQKAEVFRAPEVYPDADGREHQGSFFFHTHMLEHPNERDINKAKYIIADIIEDYFMSFDGKEKRHGSEYISIS